jgi:hypothetical protein
MNAASIATNKIAVTHTAFENREFLTFSVPNGWDDVKKLVNKVLTYEGRDFVHSGWNSDKNECYFIHIKNAPSAVATIH